MSEEYVVLPKSQWKEILDAVRTKDGSEDLILSGELAEKILAITTGITPSGTLDITENGTHDVTEYAYAEVNVPVPDGYIVPSGTLGITANGTEIDVTQYAAVNVSVPVPSGYVKPSQTAVAATYTPGTNNQSILAGTYCSGKQTILGDADLIPENIKSGVSIFGVAGSLKSGTGYEVELVTVDNGENSDGYSCLEITAGMSDLVAKHPGVFPDYLFAMQTEATFEEEVGGISDLFAGSVDGSSLAFLRSVAYNSDLEIGCNGALNYLTAEITEYDGVLINATSTNKYRSFYGLYQVFLIYAI